MHTLLSPALGALIGYIVDIGIFSSLGLKQVFKRALIIQIIASIYDLVGSSMAHSFSASAINLAVNFILTFALVWLLYQKEASLPRITIAAILSWVIESFVDLSILFLFPSLIP